MTCRLQILIDERRYELLERESHRTGRSVVDLIRESVDVVYGVDLAERRAAGQPARRGAHAGRDWHVMKQDMLDSLSASR